MDDKDSSARLSYLLGELTRNNETNNGQESTPNENSQEPSDTHLRASILSQENSVISIPSALQHVIDLQNEQLGINEPSMNRNQDDNAISRKRKRNNSIDTGSSTSSKSSLSSLGSMRTRLLSGDGKNIHNNDNNEKSLPSGSLFNSNSNSTNFIFDESTATVNTVASQWDYHKITSYLLSVTDTTTQDQSQRLFHQKSGQFYTICKDSIPTFHISSNIFNSPIEFFSKVSDIGQKYGCIKLKLNDDNLTGTNTTTAQQNLDFDNFSFKCRKQKLTSHSVINKHVLEFYHNLYSFYTTDSTYRFDIDKLPMIKGKIFNLYELFSQVHFNGGFEKVQKDNLWSNIAMELGYTKFNDEQLSIDQIYEEFLINFVTSSYNKDPSNIDHIDENAIKLVYELDGIGVDYSRIKDIKKAKHLRTNNSRYFNSAHNKARNIRINEQWQSWFPVYDEDKYTDVSSRKYKMKDYFDLSQRIFHQLLLTYNNTFPFNDSKIISLDGFEKLYYNILSSEFTDLNIYSGVDLSSTIHKLTSLNPKVTDTQLVEESDRWNLSDIPLDNDSCLKFLDLDKGDYTSSKYNVGMMFSASGWLVNDSFLPSVDYQHLGSSKVWYVIPPEDFEKFEEYLQKISVDIQNQSDTSQFRSPLSNEAAFQESDFFRIYKSNKKEKTNNLDRLTSYKDFGFNDVNKEPNLSQYLSNLQISPQILREQGIRVYRICQDVGSYVFKYPKCFTSTVGTDFYFSESAYFIPKSLSFEYLDEGSNWLASHNFLPGINYSAFLVNVVRYSKDIDLLNMAKHLLAGIIKTELSERSQVFKHFPNLEAVDNRFDFISDYSLKNTGFSKVIIKYENTKMTLSLSEFLHNLDFADNNDWVLFGVPLVKINISVHLYYQNSFFSSLSSKLNNPLGSMGINDPLLKMTLEEKISMILVEKYDDERVPLNILENLLKDTKIFDDYYYVIRGLIDKSYSLLNKCKTLWSKLSVNVSNVKPNLEAFEKNPLATLNEPQVAKFMDEFNELVKELTQSSVTFPEMEYFLQLYKIYQEFKTKVEDVVTSTKLKLMEKTYLESFEIPLDHEHCQLLINSICRFKWSDIYYELFVSFDVSEALIAKSLTFLYEFMDYGLKYCLEEDMPKLMKVRERLLLCQQIFEKVESIINTSKKGQSVPIKDINCIVEQIDKERLPIPANLKKTLNMISDCIDTTNAEQNPLIIQISSNKSYVEIMDDYIRSNSMESFKYFPKFNGSSQDRRITIKDAQGKAALVDRVVDYKTWFAEMRRITNSQSIVPMLRSAKRSLDLANDEYVPSDVEISTEEVKYCFCRNKEGKTMIECDICKEWYHTECVGGKGWTFNNDDNSIFVCPICDVNSNTVIHKLNAVNFGDLKRSVLDTVYLQVIPDKKFLQQYFELYKIALVFRNSMFDALFKDGDIDKTVPIPLVKYYLRKAEKSQIEFIDLVGPLKRYCHVIDKPQYESFKSKKLSIITV